MNTAEATEVANEELAAVLPQVPVGMLTIEAREVNGIWLVTYRPSKGSTGGPLVVAVDKRTHRGTVAHMEQ